MNQLLANSSTDQRIVYSGRSWEQFKWIQKGFAGSTGIRLFYHQGTIEILMPGRDHELFSRVIGYLVVTFLIKKGIFFQPTGAMTLEREGVVSVQADESYCLGTIKPIPDLSIEVIVTSGSLEKLARYQALGVAEVWFWHDGRLTLYHLRSTGYEPVDRSELEGLQDLNLALMQRCILMAETDAGAAIQTFQAAIA